MKRRLESIRMHILKVDPPFRNTREVLRPVAFLSGSFGGHSD